ncbi:MAG: hypothetical protein WCK51_05740 [Armatimonadota bacterium]
MRTKTNFCALAILIYALQGCGGSSGSEAVGPSVLPKVTINWPDTTRQFEASKFAMSARIGVSPASSLGAVASWTVDRPSSTAQAMRTYAGTDIKVSGPVTISVGFYTGTGATGSLVSSAVISGRVALDGSLSDSEGNPIGSIASQGKLRGIIASASSSQFASLETTVNSTAQILVTGLGEANSFIALNQEQLAPRLSSRVVLGSDIFSVNGATIQGLSEGSGLVSVALDGLATDAQVKVSPRIATVRALDVKASAIAFDGTRNTFWAAFGPTGTNANRFASVNPTTGVVSSGVSLGSEANLVSVSSDGTAAYVGLPSTSSIRKISLASGTIGPAVSVGLEGPGAPSSIAINPNNSDEVAVTVQGSVSSGNWGPVIVRSGVALPDYLRGSYSEMSRVIYLDDFTLVGASGQTTQFPTARASVTPTGCNLLASESDVLSTFGLTGLVLKNGQVFTSGGTVFDPVTLRRVDELRHPEDSNANLRTTFVVGDASSSTVWMLVAASGGSTYLLRSVDSTSRSFTGAVTVQNILGTVKGLYRVGPTGIAIHTDQSIYVIDNAPGF